MPTQPTLGIKQAPVTERCQLTYSCRDPMVVSLARRRETGRGLRLVWRQRDALQNVSQCIMQ